MKNITPKRLMRLGQKCFRKVKPEYSRTKWRIWTASEIYSAFRGRLISLLVLTHCGVLSRPLLPQESTYISYAISALRSSLRFVTFVLSQPLCFVFMYGH